MGTSLGGIIRFANRPLAWIRDTESASGFTWCRDGSAAMTSSLALKRESLFDFMELLATHLRKRGVQVSYRLENLLKIRGAMAQGVYG